MTLEELAAKYSYSLGSESASFKFDQLRAIIEKAVGIVAGEPVGYVWLEDWEGGAYAEDCFSNANFKGKTPLHAIDMGRLK